ncbi:MAG: type II secretion system F family protein [Sulfolobales archaeon]|nr:type II secretion system F family protein [Sulfolobales archaeon]
MGKLRTILMVYVDALALTLFEKFGKSLAKTFELDRSIKAAGFYTHPHIYACRILLLTLLTGILSTFLVSFVIALMPFPLLVKIIIAVFPLIISIITFALGLSYPSLSASFRKLYVDSELPFLLTYIATMARGGVTVERCLERVSRIKLFKYSSREAGEIMRRVKVFGEDPLSAIEKVAYAHPSSKFRDLMLGYMTTLRAGGDVVHYLEVKTRESLANRSAEIKSIIGRLAAFLELYIILGVVVSLTMFTFFAVSGAVTIIGGSRLAGAMDPMMPMIYNTIVLPGLGALTLVLVHVSNPRTTLPIRVPYYILMISVPFAILASLSVIVISGSTNVFEGTVRPRDAVIIACSLAAGLLTLSIPPAAVFTLEMRGSKGMIKALAEFLRDLSEVRKTGLSPEKCIITLSERDYGNLTLIVKKTATALAMGITLDKALARSIRKVRDWFLAIIFRFLIDSIVYGGGSPEIMDSLASFTQSLAESEEELRRSLRAYVLLPYFGALMVASAPLLIVWQLTSSTNLMPQPEMLSGVIVTLSTGAIINSYITGLIAGKTSQTILAAGFTHSIVITILTLAVLLFTMFSVGFI